MAGFTSFLKSNQRGLLSVSGDVSEFLQEKGANSWNKSLLRYEGHLSKKMAEIDERRLNNETNQTVGAAVANAGASGFAVDSVSTQQAIDDIIRSGELDAALIRIRGDIGKWEADMETDRIKAAETDRLVSSLFSSVSKFVR